MVEGCKPLSRIIAKHGFIHCSNRRFSSSILFFYSSQIKKEMIPNLIVRDSNLSPILLPNWFNRSSTIWMIRRKIIASLVNIYNLSVILSTNITAIPAFHDSEFGCPELYCPVDHSCIVSSCGFCSDEHFCIGVWIPLSSAPISQLESFLLKKSN